MSKSGTSGALSEGNNALIAFLSYLLAKGLESLRSFRYSVPKHQAQQFLTSL